MRLEVYSIYDAKTQVFNRPWYALTEGEALRNLLDAAGDDSSPYCRHPEDFFLYRIGTYNDATGALDPETPSGLGSIASIREPMTALKEVQ